MRKLLAMTSVVLTVAPTMGWADSSDSATSENKDNQLSEIVVTAQHRTESKFEVPISMTVMDAQQLTSSNITGAKDYLQLIPNVYMNENDAQSQTMGDVTIRGITDLTSGNGERGILSRPRVGTFVDDIPLQIATGSPNPPLYDVDRLEVLRGPQTQYFGQAAEGGAISIITKKPVNEDSVLAHAAVGNFGEADGGLVLNHILADDLYLRASFDIAKSDGYVKNLSPTGSQPNSNNQNMRLALRWVPGNWVVDATLWVQRDDEGSLGIVPTGINGPPSNGVFPPPPPFYPAAGPFSAANTCGLGTGILTTENGGNTSYICVSGPEWTDSTNVITALKAEYSGDTFTFTSVSSRVSNDYDQMSNLSQQGVDIYNRENQYNSLALSQEFRITSAVDRFHLAGLPLDWAAGVFASGFHDQTDNAIIIQPDTATYGLIEVAGGVPGDEPNVNNQSTEWDSYAGFGEIALHFDPEWSVNVGGRISHDYNSQHWTNVYNSFNCDPPRQVAANGTIPPLLPGCIIPPNSVPVAQYQNGPGGAYFVTGGTNLEPFFTQSSQATSTFTPRFTLNWHPNPDQFAYLTVSTGYLPGGTRVAPDSETLPETTGAVPAVNYTSYYKSERLQNYELGWHGYFLDRSLLVEADVFDQEWENMQYSLDATFCYLPNGQIVNQQGSQGSHCTSVPPFIFVNQILNAQHARSDGAELSFTYKPNRHLVIAGAGGYNKAIYTDFTSNNPTLIAEGLGPKNNPGDLSGAPIPNAPLWSGTLSVNTEWQIGESDWSAGITDIYKAKTFTVFGFNGSNANAWPFYDNPQHVANMHAGVKIYGNLFNLSVQNLFDSRYNLSAFGSEGALGGGVLMHPRILRFEWSRKFGGSGS